MEESDDKTKDHRVQSYFTEYEHRLIGIQREITGETAGSFCRRIVRLYLKGHLIPNPKQIDNGI